MSFEPSHPTIRLGDVATLERGFDLPDRERRSGTIPVLGSGGQVGWHDEAQTKAPSIVIGRTGDAAGEIHLRRDRVWPLNTTLYVETTDMAPRFLYYALRELDLERLASGSAQASIHPRQLEEIAVPCPPGKVQHDIADRLRCFDELIETGQTLNSTLQAILQTIFRAWFIDFEPIGDIDSEEVEALRGTAVDSPLGPIPNGWRVKQIEDVATINPEHRRDSYPHQTIEYIAPSDVEEGRILGTTEYAVDEAPKRARLIVRNRDILWQKSYPGTRSHAYVTDPPYNTIAFGGFVVLRAEDVPSTYLYHWVTQDRFVEYLTRRASEHRLVRKEVFQQAPILIPPDPLLGHFHALARPILEQLEERHRKNDTLADIRAQLRAELL